jgi:hypothetical protein
MPEISDYSFGMHPLVRRTLRPVARPVVAWLLPRILARAPAVPAIPARELVFDVFRGLLGRDPEPTAESAFVAAISNRSLTTRAMIEELMALPEFPQRMQAVLDNAQTARVQAAAAPAPPPPPPPPVRRSEPAVRRALAGLVKTPQLEQSVLTSTRPYSSLTDLILDTVTK